MSTHCRFCGVPEIHESMRGCEEWMRVRAYFCGACRFFCATAEELHVHLGGDAHEKRIADAKEST